MEETNYPSEKKEEKEEEKFIFSYEPILNQRLKGTAVFHSNMQRNKKQTNRDLWRASVKMLTCTVDLECSFLNTSQAVKLLLKMVMICMTCMTDAKQETFVSLTPLTEKPLFILFRQRKASSLYIHTYTGHLNCYTTEVDKNNGD